MFSNFGCADVVKAIVCIVYDSLVSFCFIVYVAGTNSQLLRI